MAIYLGNLTVEQIEKRLGVELSDKDKTFLRETHQDRVNNTPLETGKWHCFDIPFMFMTHDVDTAIRFRDMFQNYDTAKFKETFQIGWEA